MEHVAEEGSHLPLDHVTLRRLLVDVGLLGRDSAGWSYRVQAAGSRVSFDPALLALDVAGLVAAAEDERAARKQRHQAGAANS